MSIGESGDAAAVGAKHPREVFGDRRISLRDMDAPLKLATAGAIAGLAAAALLLGLRNVGGSSVVLLPQDGVRVTLGTPLFVVTLALLVTGFAYLATGAVLASRRIAIPMVLLMVFLLGWQTGVLGLQFRAVLPGWATGVTRALLGVVLGVALVVLLLPRSEGPPSSRLRFAVLALFEGLFIGYVVVLYAASPTISGLTDFPFSVTLLMKDIPLLVVPLVWVAAVDFGEWGQLTGEWLGGLGRGRLPHAGLVIPAMLCIALIVIAYVITDRALSDPVAHIARSTGLFALAIVVLALMLRGLRIQRTEWPHSFGTLPLVLVAAVVLCLTPYLVALVQGSIKVQPTPEVSTTGEFTAAANVRSLRTSHGFTFLVPAGWSVTTFSAGDTFAGHSADGGTVQLAVLENITFPTLASSLPPGSGAAIGPIVDSGDVESQRIAGTDGATLTMAMLIHPRGSNEPGYVARATATGPDIDAASGLVTAIARSGRQPGDAPAAVPAEGDVVTSAAADQRNQDRLFASVDLVTGLLTLAALVSLATRGRRWSPQVRGTLLLLCTLFVLGVLYDLDTYGRLLLGPDARWPRTSQPGVITCIALLGLGLLIASTRSRSGWARALPQAVSGLAGGMLTLIAVEKLYNKALAASQIPVWAAAIVLVAMAWEITMSGESFTNRSSRAMPRSSRVFLYFGYVILLAAAILFFAGQRLLASGTTVREVSFEPDAITQGGLFGLAMPVLLLLFALRVFGAHHHSSTPPDRDEADRRSISTGP